MVGGGSKYVLCSPLYLGEWSNWTNVFQMGWFNHQLIVVVDQLWPVHSTIDCFWRMNATEYEPNPYIRWIWGKWSLTWEARAKSCRAKNFRTPMYLYNCFFAEAPRVLGNTWHHICLKFSSVKVLIEKLLLHSVSPFFQCPIAPTLLSSYFHGHSRHSPLRRNLDKQVWTSNGLKTWIRETIQWDGLVQNAGKLSQIAEVSLFSGKSRHLDWKFPMGGRKKGAFQDVQPNVCLSLLGQWLEVKLFGITYLVGKISRSNFYFKVHWLSELYIWMILLSSQQQAQTSLRRCLPFASWSALGGPWVEPNRAGFRLRRPHGLGSS